MSEAVAEPVVVQSTGSVSDGYARYALVLLTVVYMLNFIDRQILSILAEDIKRDLGLRDEDIGFLYGTAFGIFYALFGVPLGRLADRFSRVKLLTVGLTLWSTATAVSGFASTGTALALGRIGVGVGEATASPCAYSLISDYFPKKSRATALAVYSSGVFLGSGLAMLIGGAIVGQWNAAYPSGGPLGLVGWQAAYLAVGAPGLALALWISTLYEPARGGNRSVEPVSVRQAFSEFWSNVATIVPPFTLLAAIRRSWSALFANAVAAAIALVAGISLSLLTGDVAQWTAVCVGGYAVYSWATSLRHSDPPTYRLIWQTPAFLGIVLCYGLIAFIAYSASFWAAPYAMRTFAVDRTSAGLIIGGLTACGGFVGVIAGGRLADWARARHPSGRILVIATGSVLAVPAMILAYLTDSLIVFYVLQFPISAFTSSTLAGAAATTQDLVLPRMRGTATATFFLGTTLLGLALGPYLAGRISTWSGSLGIGILSLLAVVPVLLLGLAQLYKSLPEAEETALARARQAGEPS